MKRKTARDRLSAGTAGHEPMVSDASAPETSRAGRGSLDQKLKGHYAYYGITGNYAALLSVLQRRPAELEEVAQPTFAMKRVR